MLGARHELVVGVEDHLLALMTGAHDALHDQPDAEPDTRHRRAAEPLGNDVAAPVDDGRLDRAAALPRVDADVLDDSGDLVPLSHLDFGDGNDPGDAPAPRPEQVCSGVIGAPCKALEEPAGTCHDGQVWQYRRARVLLLEGRTMGIEDAVEGVLTKCM
jgi:hypothetical protein